MKRLLIIAGSLAIALGMGIGAFAHHSAAGVDQQKQVTVEGTVKQFKWANPHSWVLVEVPNAKGGTDLWNFEMTSPTFLVQAGWKSNSLKFGDKVKITGNPMKNGDPGGLFVSVTLADGKVLRGGSGAPAAPRGAAAPAAGAPRGGAAPAGTPPQRQ